MTEIETPVAPRTTRPRPLSRLALAAAALAMAVALAAALAGLGSRWDLWHFRTGFTMLRWAVYAGIAVGVLSLIAIARARPGGPRRGFAFAFFAFVLMLFVVVVPWQQRRSSRGVPPIHDISTDTENPPPFVAIAPLRADAPNPVEYAGPEAASRQRQAYPEIQPVVVGLPPDTAFVRALAAARAKRWEIVEANAAEGRIEATDRTFWFGFYDDVVIRITPSGTGSIVDVRSKSRVGRGDMGTNARRIRGYLRELQSRT
jgi:uncharacterized protein (DUF1499 family)